MTTLALADELALIRGQIDRLRAREQELRHTLIAAPPAARLGRWTHVEVMTRTIRVFDHRLLPAGVRDDPCFWRERSMTVARCQRLSGAGAAQFDDSTLQAWAAASVPSGRSAHAPPL